MPVCFHIGIAGPELLCKATVQQLNMRAREEKRMVESFDIEVISCMHWACQVPVHTQGLSWEDGVGVGVAGREMYSSVRSTTHTIGKFWFGAPSSRSGQQGFVLGSECSRFGVQREIV